MSRFGSVPARSGGWPPRSLAPWAGAVAAIGALAWALYRLPLLSLSANRLAVGAPISGGDLGGAAMSATMACGAIALLLSAGSRSRRGALLALALFAAAGATLALRLGSGASEVLVGRPSAARASLGSGAWIALALLSAGSGWASRRGRAPGLAVAAAAVGCLIIAGHGGAFDAVSLAVEFNARRQTMAEALAEHLALSGGALALAIVGAVALSLWRRGQGLVGIVVSGIQVIPAVALLGGLVALLSAVLRAAPALRELGVTALGPAPAIVAIAAYLLLPLWRGIAAALRAPDAATRDAAQAIGLSRAQILARVTLPLGAPALIGALRVAVVQSLGLATLGALIGAGGLGRIVFDGMAQFASDLILLGAIPIVALSLCAERLLSAVETRAARRWPA